ncbi:deleted in malignant brain tumors 1 protein isoform X3 [Gadus morhua]|uniref:deleted in malignant brain tumors 1 protein isoform X3 n=1 Tax=Gadus morhua TaxID=8049 RepID=UPI0011B5BB03|nr:deleted in malignant brain tumors 1 protein-like isoform X3 [Gadus morhua]
MQLKNIQKQNEKMEALGFLVLCSAMFSHCVQAQDSCRYNCGNHLGSCSCDYSCQYNGNCCFDYYYQCISPTADPPFHTPDVTTAQESCRHNCGYNLGSCSCEYYCQSYGNCCYDYNSQCPYTTITPDVTTAQDSCRYNCGNHLGSCSCHYSCESYGNCCDDYYYQCISPTADPPFHTPDVTTAQESCRHNCGYNLGSCSCEYYCQSYGNCCYDYNSQCPYTTITEEVITAQDSCSYNCGNHLGSCSCDYSCQYYGNCCYDYYYQCVSPSPGPTFDTTVNNCGGWLYSTEGYITSPNYPQQYPNNMNCVWVISPGYEVIELEFLHVELEGSDCRFDGIQVYDGPSINQRQLGRLCGNQRSTFHSTGKTLTVRFTTDGSQTYQGFRAEYRVVADGSCRYNCGYLVGNCSCDYSCESYGNCCYDYLSQCMGTTAYPPDVTTAQESCRYNCGNHLGSCSCDYSCQYYGNCCYDYNSQCSHTTFTPDVTTAQESCRYNCGNHLGSCSCDYSCQYYGNCCYDYYSQCYDTSTTDVPTVNNCGWWLYSTEGYITSPNYPQQYPNNMDCVWVISPGYEVIELEFLHVELEGSDCRFDGIQVYDGPSINQRQLGRLCGNQRSTFHSTGKTLTVRFTTDSSQTYQGFRAEYRVVADGSCRYNCGYLVGNCSCDYSCESYGNCCYDYLSQCMGTTAYPPDVTTAQESCRYNCGNHLGSCSCDYSCQYYGNCCYDYNSQCSYNTFATDVTTAQESCRYNCGNHLGSCSCDYSCQYDGNCCYDYYSQCYNTASPDVTTGPPCGGSLSISGSFSSPGYPGNYHDNSHCVWQLRASNDHKIYLSFIDLQLENCCSCDYVAVYDGPSVNSQPLGKLCNNTLNFFQSSSTYLTVLFRTDGSVTGRGFNAEFKSSLPPGAGRVECSSDNMNIVIEKSYLDSLGYDGHSLYLNDQYCRPQISAFQVIFSFPMNTCGTEQKFESGRIVYTNAVRAFESDYGLITRQSSLKLNVDCHMEPDTTVQNLYIARAGVNDSITGMGRFNGTMAFYTSRSFTYMVTQVPYMVTLNQAMYVQVNLRRDDKGLVLFLDTCVASPSPHDFQNNAYDLVRNGCGVDSTYQAYDSGTKSYARFTFRAFQFLRTHESVYLQCKVVVCPASASNSRCRRGCSRRRARALRASEDSHTLVLGPLTLQDLGSQGEASVKEEVAPEKTIDI